MDGGQGKLIELLLIVGALAWFGYAQLRSVRRRPPPDQRDAKRQPGPDDDPGDRG